MKSRLAIAALFLLVLPGGFYGIWTLQHSIDAQRAAMAQDEEVILVSSPKLVKAMSLEYAPLMAAIYWTRAVQYYGNKSLEDSMDYRSLWPLLDVATTLDPQLMPAYRFGSTFLSEPPPRGAGQPERAIQLLEKGIQANPDQWRLYQDLAYVYYFQLKDYTKASQAFLKGSEIPGAMIWMKIMAARIAEKGESNDTSAFLWKQIYDTTTDEQVKENARIHLVLMRADDDIAQLNLMCDAFEKTHGRKPTHAHDLVEAGFLPKDPVDPLGYPYIVNENGKTDLSPESPLYKQRPIYGRELP